MAPVTEQRDALRRDLERLGHPGTVGLYLAGVEAALVAVVREHPELAPVVARQLEHWRNALTPDPEPPPGHRFRRRTPCKTS